MQRHVSSGCVGTSANTMRRHKTTPKRRQHTHIDPKVKLLRVLREHMHHTGKLQALACGTIGAKIRVQPVSVLIMQRLLKQQGFIEQMHQGIRILECPSQSNPTQPNPTQHMSSGGTVSPNGAGRSMVTQTTG